MRATSRQSPDFHVDSADGTQIAVWVAGDGPPLVMVHGALSDHTTYDRLVDELAGDVATFVMDRRGRGASGDAAEYSIEREFEDVAAVVDAVAGRAGAPVSLWGNSYGADCAMGGAALTDHVGGLVLYEPGPGLTYPPGSIEAVEEAVAAGDMEAALLGVLVGIVQMTEDEVDYIRSGPLWATRLALAPTVPRELRAESDWVYRAGQFEGIRAPTLILAGSESPSDQQDATRRAAASIPNSEVRVLQGHAHIAHATHPALVASIIREFISS